MVDRFVLVEADRTHTNSSKPLHFRDNAARFDRFRDKIVHVIVTEAPEDHDPWVRENFQRECIGRGLGGLRDDDLVLICDVDEIPRREVMAELRRRPRDVSGLRMPLYRFRFNFVNIAGCRDLFGHHGHRWEIVRLDDYFPQYLLANRERFAHRIAPEGIAVMDDFRKRMTREGSELLNSWNGLVSRLHPGQT